VSWPPLSLPDPSPCEFGCSELMQSVHPSAEVRSAAEYCGQVLSANSSAITFSRALYDALAKLHNHQRRLLRDGARTLPPNDPKARGRDVLVSHDALRYVRKTLEDFEHRGIGIVPAAQQDAFIDELRARKSRMTDLSQKFEATLANDRRGLWVAYPSVTIPEQATVLPATLSGASAMALSAPLDLILQGLPTDFVKLRLRSVTPEQWAEATRTAAAVAKESGLLLPYASETAAAPATVLEISTDYPDSVPVAKYAVDRRLRAAAAMQSANRGFPENAKTLASLMSERAAYAQRIAETIGGTASPLTLDSCSWAGLSLKDMMAKTPASVRELLQQVVSIVEPAAQKESQALQSLLEQEIEALDPSQKTLPPQLQTYDVSYLLEQAMFESYNVSSQEVRSYFTYAHARRGVLTTAARLFGLRFAVVAAPSLGIQGPGSKAADREIDVCLQSDFGKALPVCDRSAVTSLDASAVEAEVSAAVEPHRWHPSVEVLDVYTDASEGDEAEDTARGEYIGRIYIDAFPRKDKYKHMAMFPVRPGLIRWRRPSSGRRELAERHRSAGLADVSEQRPEAALVCNFEPQGHMEHGDVVTLFHEFGHALHHILGGQGQRFAGFSGTATETDFVEVPSQLNEAFAWDAVVLRSFAAKQVESSASLASLIPADLVEAMSKADAVGRAIMAKRQVYLSMVSLSLHSGEVVLDPDLEGSHGRSTVDPHGSQQQTLSPPPSARCPATSAPVSLDEATQRLAKRWSPFPLIPGTHPLASFGHLVGYGSNYYSYTWSDVIVKDMLGPFETARDATKPIADAEKEAADAGTAGNSTAEAEAEERSKSMTEELKSRTGGDAVGDAAGSLLAALNPAARYKRDVLELGGRLDGADIVKGFLGREFQYNHYHQWLTEGKDAPWLDAS
jgi:Zn-dependent oligopeptidase